MQFTILAWLVVLARLAIYCNRTVLSLPPSVINDAGSLSREQQHRPWKKDSEYIDSNKPMLERTLGDVRDKFDNIVRSNENTPLLNNNKIQVKPKHQFNTDMNEQFTGKYDFKSLLSNEADEEALKPVLPRIHAAAKSNLPFTPLKYYARLCQATKNCPAAYYRTLLSNRNKTAALNLPQSEAIDFSDELKPLADNVDNIDDDYYDSNNDIILLLTAEHDLLMFLNMALQQLYSYEHLANSTLGFENDDNYNTADNYHPGMYLWRKSVLSGQLEPKLLVDEPYYILGRPKLGVPDLIEENIPFIPPRGRKHDNLPDLDALLNRYETFVPNRGKRDKIKDMLKYDDLFYPNRGKKNAPTVQNNDALLAPLLTSPHWPSSSIVQLEQLQNYLQQQRQRQRQQQQQRRRQQKWLEKVPAIYNNDNNGRGGLQQDMSSMYKMNVYDQSVKPSMPSAMAAKKISTAIKNAMFLPQQHNEQQQQQQQLQHMLLMMIARNVADGDDAANRLQHLMTAKTTRSMSTMDRQQQNSMKKEPFYSNLEIQQQQQNPSKQDHQKSLTNFEVPMLWRHLQLLKQKALTMPQPELPTHKHFDYNNDYTRQLQKKLYPDIDADTDTDTQEAQLVQTYP